MPKSAVNLAGGVNQRVREFWPFGAGARAEMWVFGTDPVTKTSNQRGRHVNAVAPKRFGRLRIYDKTPCTLAPGVAVNQMGY